MRTHDRDLTVHYCAQTRNLRPACAVSPGVIRTISRSQSPTTAISFAVCRTEGYRDDRHLPHRADPSLPKAAPRRTCSRLPKEVQPHTRTSYATASCDRMIASACICCTNLIIDTNLARNPKSNTRFSSCTPITQLGRPYIINGASRAVPAQSVISESGLFNPKLFPCLCRLDVSCTLGHDDQTLWAFFRRSS